MQNTIHFIVSGRVQGVFFRAACKKLADRYRITGWVRNMPDGRVEGMATAEADRLLVLCDWLKHGPELANVVKLEIKDLPVRSFELFEIRKHGAEE